MTADTVADILAIADAAGAETFAWWGYSYGGAVGLQLAARTDRVSALVVGGFPPLWQPLSDMLLALHQMEDQLELAGLTGESSFLLNQDSIHFYTSIAQINQLDLLDKITAPRMVYHDVDDTVGIGGMVHDLSRRTREGADTLKARGWEIQWMETGMAHYGLGDYQKNLDAFAPFLDRVLLGKAVVDVVLETAVGNITLPIPGAKKAARIRGDHYLKVVKPLLWSSIRMQLPNRFAILFIWPIRASLIMAPFGELKKMALYRAARIKPMAVMEQAMV